MPRREGNKYPYPMIMAQVRRISPVTGQYHTERRMRAEVNHSGKIHISPARYGLFDLAPTTEVEAGWTRLERNDVCYAAMATADLERLIEKAKALTNGVATP